MSYNNRSGRSESIEDVIRRVDRRRFSVVRSGPTTLLLDLDSPEAVAQFERLIPLVRDIYSVSKLDRWPSKDGGEHVRLTLDKALVSPRHRIGIQAILGSDPMREALSLKRIEEGQEEPSVLFRPRK